VVTPARDALPVGNRLLTIGQSRRQTNSAAVPLFGRLIPLFGGKNSAVRPLAELRAKSNQINNLEGRILSYKKPEQTFLLFFPVEQGNPMTETYARDRLRPSPA
jgi:hypothetical protein